MNSRKKLKIIDLKSLKQQAYMLKMLFVNFSKKKILLNKENFQIQDLIFLLN